jgi:NADPH-dependent curcumin reductase CurA
MVIARVVTLARRPAGVPAAADFAIEDQIIDCQAGGFIVAILYASIDPAMRTWISGEESYRAPVAIGEAMPALAIGRVVSSRNERFPLGALVRGPFGVASHAASCGEQVTHLQAVTPDALPHYLGVLGISGLSAWFGLIECGGLRPGDRVLVSGAAGAVGSAAIQIAKIAGADVVGVAGGVEKCAWAAERFGLPMLDYRLGSLGDDIAAAFPGGIDLVFDNVGGAFLEAALDHLAEGARVIICGGISQYNSEERRGPSNYLNLVVRRASMCGFLVHDHAALFPEAIRRLARWQGEGRLVGAVDVEHGLENFAGALAGLFSGANRGKRLLAPNPELL